METKLIYLSHPIFDPSTKIKVKRYDGVKINTTSGNLIIYYSARLKDGGGTYISTFKCYKLVKIVKARDRYRLFPSFTLSNEDILKLFTDALRNSEYINDDSVIFEFDISTQIIKVKRFITNKLLTKYNVVNDLNLIKNKSITITNITIIE